MDLEQFVETTLKQIISGVKKAQDATQIQGKHPSEANVINPPVMYNADFAPNGKYFATQDRNLVHFVDFDVAVTADSHSKATGGVSLRIASMGFGGEGGVTDRDSVVSRIKFQVPIILPRAQEEQK
jgi:hypothetical protein